MVMLYAMSSLSVQSLPDLADRMKLAIATSKSEIWLEHVRGQRHRGTYVEN